MNPRQLEAFLATVRCGSVTAAARELSIAQPSASRLIADLEKSIGFRLFVRSGRGLIPTPEARQFHRAVNSMYVGIDRIRQTAHAIRLSGQDVLSLGMIAVFAHSDLMQAVNNVYASREALRVSVSVRTNEEIIQAVRLQQLDLGIVSPLHSIEELHTLFRIEVPYVCLMPIDHPLATTDARVDLKSVLNEPFVSLPTRYLAATDTDTGLVEHLAANARLQSHSVPAVASLARNSNSLALVDQYTAAIACALGKLTSRSIKQELSLPVAVVCHATDTLTEPGHQLAGQIEIFLRENR